MSGIKEFNCEDMFVTCVNCPFYNKTLNEKFDSECELIVYSRIEKKFEKFINEKEVIQNE